MKRASSWTGKMHQKKNTVPVAKYQPTINLTLDATVTMA